MTAPEIPTLRMDRRSAIKWMLAVASSATLLDRDAIAAESPKRAGAGYGTDPDLLRDYKPGDLWPLTFNESQHATAAALCDVIIPADAVSPSASVVGVHDFIDEWISAPYPEQTADRQPILDGLAWIEAEAQRRYQATFVAITPAQKTALCADLCFLPTARPQFKTAAQFFKRYRDLTAGGFYTTPVGMKDIGYTGNEPIAIFPEPSADAMKKIGLS